MVDHSREISCGPFHFSDSNTAFLYLVCKHTKGKADVGDKIDIYLFSLSCTKNISFNKYGAL